MKAPLPDTATRTTAPDSAPAPAPAPGTPGSDPPGATPDPSAERVMLPERVADVPDADRGPLTGRLIQGRYLIKGLIGEGGMGSVYRAEHTLMGKELAIKVLLPEYGDVESIAKRFQQEAQSVSRLEHPGIIQVFDFGYTEEGHLFLAMSLLQGRSLTEVIHREAPLTPARAVPIAIQVCEALLHAHEQGVIHRDLKPDNVMVVAREGGELVKILDFGIARVTEGEGAAKGMTELGMVFGTPEYLSPEQAAGDVADARSDLYALGVILYEMLTGKKPFLADSAMLYIQAHLHQPPPPFKERAPELTLPPALQNVVLKALSKRPADRYPSGLALADALRALQLAPFALPAAALVSKSSFPPGGLPDLSGAAPAPASIVVGPDPGFLDGPPETTYVGPPPHAHPTVNRALKVWGLVALGLLLFLLVVLLAVIAGSSDEPSKGARPGMRASPADAAVVKEALDLATMLPEVERLVAKRQWPEAEKKLQALMSRWPRDSRLLLLQGHLHRGRARPQAALGSYQSAILLQPDLREDEGLLAGLDEVLRTVHGSHHGRSTREAAVGFITGPFVGGAALGPGATKMLLKWVTQWWEHDLVWKVASFLEARKAMTIPAFRRVYRLRFQSVPDCEARERMVLEIAQRKDERLLPLLQELIKEPYLKAFRGNGKVPNACLRTALVHAIESLGGEVPDSAIDAMSARSRRRRGRRR